MTSTASIKRITGTEPLPSPRPAPRTDPTNVTVVDVEAVMDDLSDAIQLLAEGSAAVESLAGLVEESRAHRMVWEASPDDDAVSNGETVAALFGMRTVADSADYFRAERDGFPTAMWTVRDGEGGCAVVFAVDASWKPSETPADVTA